MSQADWRTLYPFASHWLTLSAGRMHYLSEGQGGVLLFVHGNPTWSFYWRRLVLAFRDRYRVVVPDHLGCGLSDKPPTFSYRLADHIANLQQLIEQLDLREITLVGHDWGGCIGLGAAGRMPERFARLVLCNTGAFRSDHMPWRIAACRIPVLGRLAVQGLNGFVRGALRMGTARPERFTPEVRAGYLAPYDTWAHRIATHRFVLDIPTRPSHPSYSTLVEVEQNLARLNHLPTLLAWGTRDWCFTPAFAERFQEFFPQADRADFNYAGHLIAEDAVEDLAACLAQFFARHPTAGQGGGATGPRDVSPPSSPPGHVP